MINDLNRVTLMGHIGDDAKPSQADNAPVTFSLATSSHWMTEGTRNTRTEWHNVVVFGNLRKYAAKLKKGDRVYVEGQLRANNYDKTVGNETIKVKSYEVIAIQIERVTAKSEDEQ